MHVGVAPHAGAWIETLKELSAHKVLLVAPHAGAWIETDIGAADAARGRSLPMRERGLKHHKDGNTHNNSSRSPCGSVD